MEIANDATETEACAKILYSGERMYSTQLKGED